jgi:hypothetical protein
MKTMENTKSWHAIYFDKIDVLTDFFTSETSLAFSLVEASMKCREKFPVLIEANSNDESEIISFEKSVYAYNETKDSDEAFSIEASNGVLTLSSIFESVVGMLMLESRDDSETECILKNLLQSNLTYYP